MDLIKKKCVPCEGGVQPMRGDEIKIYISYLKSEWQVQEGKKITKQFMFKDFKESIRFVNNIAEIAESEGHHPDIKVSYNIVKICLWTHAIGGLSVNDFIVARKIEEIL